MNLRYIEATSRSSVSGYVFLALLAASVLALWPSLARAQEDLPPPVENLRCIAETGRVAFLWDAPEWSGGKTYAYDYQLSLPGGQSAGGRLIGITLVHRPGSYTTGKRASVSVAAVYETTDGRQVSSAEKVLVCAVGGEPPIPTVTPTPTPAPTATPTPTPGTSQDGGGEYTALIAQMYEWRNDPRHVGNKAHTDRWDRALLAFRETVSDTTLLPMTAAEAQTFVDRGWTRWTEVAAALREIESGSQQQGTPNQPPTVSAAIADVTIVSESGTRQVSLSGVFSDADKDTLTISATSSNEAVAIVSVASDYATLTVTAKARGTADITVTADDGGGTVEDTFTVRVKASPTVATRLADVSGLAAGSTQEVSLSGVFGDPDGDSLTIIVSSSDEAIATVTAASDGSTLTVAGVAEGTATITVMAQDDDGNRVLHDFAVVVAAVSSSKYAVLVAQMYEWRNDSRYVGDKAHTDRWDRTLLAFGETVADTTLTPLAADEAQGYADRGWSRWVDVAAALRQLELVEQQDPANEYEFQPQIIGTDDKVTIYPTSLSVNEDESMTYWFHLKTRPTAPVTVTAISSDGDAISVTGPKTVSSPSWQERIKFTFSGKQDSNSTHETVTITHTFESADPEYNGLEIQPIQLTVIDDDTTSASVNITATTNVRTEENDLTMTSLGLPASFTITPSFRSDHYEYEVSVPNSVGRLIVGGRYTSPYNGNGYKGFGWIQVGDTSESERISGGHFHDIGNTMIIADSERSLRTDQVALTPGVPATLEIALYKWKQGKVCTFPVSSDNTIKRVYTLTVTRATD